VQSAEVLQDQSTAKDRRSSEYWFSTTLIRPTTSVVVSVHTWKLVLDIRISYSRLLHCPASVYSWHLGIN